MTQVPSSSAGPHGCPKTHLPIASCARGIIDKHDRHTRGCFPMFIGCKVRLDRVEYAARTDTVRMQSVIGS